MIEYQRVWAEINLDNIAHNISRIRKKVGNNIKIMSIVKADAYGHGAVVTAKVLLYNGADCLGVATCDEGIDIRQNNIFVPTLILGYTPESKLNDVIKFDLIQTIFNIEMAQSLSRCALKLGKKVHIHIKVDTGMSRLGFLPNKESVNDIITISNLPNINISGIYTHFADSSGDSKDFTYEQQQKFVDFLKCLEQAGINIPIKHCSNSGAILNYCGFNMDMVRPGILQYGLKPSNDTLSETNFNELNLKPIMSLKTQVSYVKTLPEGVSIGYGRTYFTKRETKVATIPVGYADGYSRAMGNKGRVLINGESAPIIGTICMDQFMVDITKIDNVKNGDEVTLIGVQGKNEISADEIASLENTINYEVICNIGKRVPRIYLKNNKVLSKQWL